MYYPISVISHTIHSRSLSNLPPLSLVNKIKHLVNSSRGLHADSGDIFYVIVQMNKSHSDWTSSKWTSSDTIQHIAHKINSKKHSFDANKDSRRRH